jgi:hypothetical protein
MEEEKAWNIWDHLAIVSIILKAFSEEHNNAHMHENFSPFVSKV